MDVTDLDLESRLLAGLPIVNVFYDRLGIDRLLDAHVPGDPRLWLSPSAALYDTADGHVRGGKPTPTASPGFSKDLPSHCVVSPSGVANSPGSLSTWIRRPSRLPRRACTALSSPRWTRCNTVCRATPRIVAA